MIVDLGRMNRIHTVDGELGYAVIEPGVTQRQLAEHLAEQGMPFWCDCTGSGPNSSLIGNIVERGFGHTPTVTVSRRFLAWRWCSAAARFWRPALVTMPMPELRTFIPMASGRFWMGYSHSPTLASSLGLAYGCCQFQNRFVRSWCCSRKMRICWLRYRPCGTLRLTRVLHKVPHIGNDLRALSSAMAYFPAMPCRSARA